MKPRIAITMGDPAGIGPEIVLKALLNPDIADLASYCVVGSSRQLLRAARVIGNERIMVQAFDKPSPVSPRSSPSISVLEPEGTDQAYQYGVATAAGGRASVSFLTTAARLAATNVVDAIVTAPINKEAMRAASIPFAGHTELLGDYFGTKVETMFVVDTLRIFFLTRHMALRDAIGALSTHRLLALIHHALDVLSGLGISDPVLAIAGLNPHAGDGGLFGREEIDVLEPAIQAARAQGWNVQGPVGADSVFHWALKGKYDAVISLYHDQGHIAAKTYDFNRTVSVTTGLPIIRTSVDHGTAYDIVGQNVADATNMMEAIKLAAQMSRAQQTIRAK